MTTAVFLGLMLAFEPIEHNVMHRPPRRPGTPILDAALVWRIVLVSVLLLAGSFGLFLRELAAGQSLAEARTVAVNVFVVVEAMYLFNCRSLTLSALRVGLFSNPAIWYGVLSWPCCRRLLTYVPLMNRLFATAPIGLAEWLEIFRRPSAASKSGSLTATATARISLVRRRAHQSRLSGSCVEDDEARLDELREHVREDVPDRLQTADLVEGILETGVGGVVIGKAIDARRAELLEKGDQRVNRQGIVHRGFLTRRPNGAARENRSGTADGQAV
jgi:hypothetical protein